MSEQKSSELRDEIPIVTLDGEPYAVFQEERSCSLIWLGSLDVEQEDFPMSELNETETEDKGAER